MKYFVVKYFWCGETLKDPHVEAREKDAAAGGELREAPRTQRERRAKKGLAASSEKRPNAYVSFFWPGRFCGNATTPLVCNFCSNVRTTRAF